MAGAARRGSYSPWSANRDEKPASLVKVVFLGGFGKTADVPEGTTLLEAASAAKIETAADCGGRGTCGKCRVRVSGRISAPSETERKHLTTSELEKNIRLACEARAVGECSVSFENEAVSSEILPFVSDYKQDPSMETDPLFPGKEPCYGVAIDIGTTSLNIRLMDITSRESAAAAVAANPQRIRGADVATRINYTIENGGGLTELKALVSARLSEMIEYLAKGRGLVTENVTCAVVAGNPTMISIVMGLDPKGIAQAPYTPPFTGPVVTGASEMGLRLAPGSKAAVLPIISAYVGADTVAQH